MSRRIMTRRSQRIYDRIAEIEFARLNESGDNEVDVAWGTVLHHKLLANGWIEADTVLPTHKKPFVKIRMKRSK